MYFGSVDNHHVEVSPDAVGVHGEVGVSLEADVTTSHHAVQVLGAGRLSFHLFSFSFSYRGHVGVDVDVTGVVDILLWLDAVTDLVQSLAQEGVSHPEM